MKSFRRNLTIISLFAALLVTTGCRARVIKVRLTNASAEPLSIIEVAYPGGTFGKNSLAAGEVYSYNVKILDEGRLKIQFTDAQGGNHKADGPAVKKGQEGSIEIRLSQDSVSAEPNLL